MENEEPIEENEEPVGDDEARDLDPRDREDIEADLDDLAAMRGVFEPQGTRGVVIACPDCGSNHFYDWDLLKENLEHMLETGEARMHEPAFEPREEDYVLWDYGKGYVDALIDAGVDAGRRVDLTACPWCGSTLETTFTYCPACGRSLGPVRIYRELVGGGMEERDVRALLSRAGFEPF